MKVLIVEDSPERIASLKELFWAHEVTVTGTADGAVQLLAAEPYDLLQLDYDLASDTKGTEVATALIEIDFKPIVIVHSENPEGVVKILSIVPEAIVCPMSRLQSKSSWLSRLKAALANSTSNVSELKQLILELAEAC